MTSPGIVVFDKLDVSLPGGLFGSGLGWGSTSGWAGFGEVPKPRCIPPDCYAQPDVTVEGLLPPDICDLACRVAEAQGHAARQSALAEQRAMALRFMGIMPPLIVLNDRQVQDVRNAAKWLGRKVKQAVEDSLVYKLSGLIMAAVNGKGDAEQEQQASEALGADSEKGSNVRENNSKGTKAEDEVASDLEGEGRQTERQVRKDTPFGQRVIDIEVKDKDGNVLGGVEVKSGNSRYRHDQRSKDEWLRRNGYPVDVVRKP
jgi:hypothetical protein